MEISKSEYSKLLCFEIPEGMHNTDKIFIKDGRLFKIFSENSFIEEKERNIAFLMNTKIPCTPLIYDKLFSNGEFVGYVMEYIPNALTFRQALSEDIPHDLKIAAIRDIYVALKYFHSENIYLGDVHSDNMLLTESGKGYIIDLEEVRFPGDEYKFKQCYLISPNNNSNRINVPSQYTDNVKVMISSLSLLLGKDLEKYISKQKHDINLEQLFNEVIMPLNDSYLNEYFYKLMNEESVPYFSDYYLPELNKIKK